LSATAEGASSPVKRTQDENHSEREKYFGGLKVEKRDRIRLGDFMHWTPSPNRASQDYSSIFANPFFGHTDAVHEDSAKPFSKLPDHPSAEFTLYQDGEVRGEQELYESRVPVALTVEDNKDKNGKKKKPPEPEHICDKVRIIDGVERLVPLYSEGGYSRVHERIHVKPSIHWNPRVDYARYNLVCGMLQAYPVDNTPRVPVPEPPPKISTPCHLKFEDFVPSARPSAKENDIRSRFMPGAEFAETLFAEGQWDKLWFIAQPSLKMTAEEKEWRKRALRGRAQPWDIGRAEYEYILTCMLAKDFVGIGRSSIPTSFPSVEARQRQRIISRQAEALLTADKWKACLFSASSDAALARQFGVTDRWIYELRTRVNTECADYNRAQHGAWKHHQENIEDVSWIIEKRLFDFGEGSRAGLVTDVENK
jgi:hypothetical protein